MMKGIDRRREGGLRYTGARSVAFMCHIRGIVESRGDHPSVHGNYWLGIVAASLSCVASCIARKGKAEEVVDDPDDEADV